MQTRCWRWMGILACVLCLSAVAKPLVFADEKLDDYELMKLFVDSFNQIEKNYVKEVPRRKLVEAAIRGMIADLDRYSSYISPEEITQFNQMVDQEFGGIGIQVTQTSKTGPLTVASPLPGSPAYKAGVLAGDVIMKIEGKSAEGFNITDAVKLLKGKPGEPVTITVKHTNSIELEDIRIVREIIQISTVLGDIYNADGSWKFLIDDANKIAYVRLTHFSRRSGAELRKALEKLTKKGMKGLVLDLRMNPGGLLSQATAVSDLFIEEGKIVSTEGRNIPERIWEATKQGTFSGFPMAVLVNHHSASASEIVSACLQDHKRAVIVGERTWGKGSVQNVIELESGSSALKLTTASYHRPSGKNIHRFPNAKETDEWGVMPDKGYELKLTFAQRRALYEYRVARDVLSEEGPPKSDFKDEQLEMAVQYLLKDLGVAKPATEKKASETDKKNALRPLSGNKPGRKSASRNRISPKPVLGAA